MQFHAYSVDRPVESRITWQGRSHLPERAKGTLDPALQRGCIDYEEGSGTNGSSCAYDCGRDGWVLHSRDGQYVYVGNSGDVISTATRQIVKYLDPLYNSRKYLEIDWRTGVPVDTTTRYGLGQVTN